MEDRSVTAVARKFLDADARGELATFDSPFAPGQESLISLAHKNGQTLQAYVAANAEESIMTAESALSYWLDIQASAAITGYITTEDGEKRIDKNMTKLIELRVDAAQRQLDKVNEYAITSFKTGEQRKDHIIRALYNRGIQKGDTKALIYLIDRVDGRPGEAKINDLDYDNAYNVYQLIHCLFDKQLEVLNSGAGTRLVCCSRRAGKSTLVCAALLIECLRKPNTIAMYIGETLELSIQNIIDPTMNQLIDTYQLRDKAGKRLNWKKLDNGSKIIVRGLSSTKDPDQIRGVKAKVIAIDEFFHLKSELLSYLESEVLRPMQMDYADDYMFLCVGTPPSIKGTYGEKAWQEWQVPHFTWTYKDNPHPIDVEKREAYVLKELAEKGLTMDSAYARREYGGEWIYDEDLLLYPEFATYNPREYTPEFHIDMVLFGIDYGVGDNDSIIGIAWDTLQRRGYTFHEEKFNRLDIKDRTISQLQYMKQQVKYLWREALDFFPNMSPREANKRVLWDADDSDQHVTDELNMSVRLDGSEYDTLRLQIQNAHKTDKVIMFDKIRDLLRTNGLLLMEDGVLSRECEMTVLKRGANGQVYPEVDDRVFHPDGLPAMRYALWNVIGQEAAPKKQ
jgi:hypothetical protein